jgi:hypothetical protein
MKTIFCKENKLLDIDAKLNVLATYFPQIELVNYFS